MPSRKPALDTVVVGTAFGGIAAFFILGPLADWPLGGLVGSSLFGIALAVMAWRERADLQHLVRTRAGRAQTAWILLAYLTAFVPSLVGVIGSHLLAGVLLWLGFIAVILSAAVYEWDNRRRARTLDVPVQIRWTGSASAASAEGVSFAREVRHSTLCRECISRPTDHLLIGEDGRSVLPTGADCPCLASYTTACLLCQAETAQASDVEEDLDEELANASDAADQGDESEEAEPDPGPWGPLA